MAEERSWFAAGVFYGLLFLVFFQLLAEFIEAVYAFGLMGTGVPPEIVAVLLLLSPVLLLLFRGDGPRRLPDALLTLVMVARVVMPLPGTYGRMILAGLGVAAWLMAFPVLIRRSEGEDARATASAMASGLFLATLASALLRTVGSGLDISTVGWGQVIGWVIVAGLGGMWWGRMRTLTTAPPAPGNGGIFLPLMGVMAILTLLYFVFTAPHVLARWTGVDYRWVLAVYAVAAVAWAWLCSERVSRGTVFGASAVLVVALAATAFVHQVAFPTVPTSYPIPEARVSAWHQIPLFVALLAFPVLFVDMVWLMEQVLSARPSLSRLGGTFTLTALFLLVMIFAHVFTTTYDYIPVVGPFFRDRFWQVHLVVGLVLLVALPEARSATTARLAAARRLLPAVGVLAGAALVAVFVVTARPSPPPTDAARVTVMTYNVQQGYSRDGQRNFDGQLAVIRKVRPDILGLEETDDARVANGNADIVRYFANHLNMYSYYGPKTVTGTFGIALLSRYPIRAARTWFLYSVGEQVAVIEARVNVGGRTFHVFVTHLGNGGPIEQQREFLTLVKGKARVVAMGDFNFRPDTEQYRLTTKVLVDTWTARWPAWRDARGVAPRQKIDHIFVSPDVQVLDARYIPAGPSDHPAVVAVLANGK